jgi:hypothetical protein
MIIAVRTIIAVAAVRSAVNFVQCCCFAGSGANLTLVSGVGESLLFSLLGFDFVVPLSCHLAIDTQFAFCESKCCSHLCGVVSGQLRRR